MLIIPGTNDRALSPFTISARSHTLPCKSYLANHLMYESIPWYEFELILLYLRALTILFFSNLVDLIPPNWEDPLHFMMITLYSSGRLGNTRLSLKFFDTQLVLPFNPLLPCARQTINIKGAILRIAASLAAMNALSSLCSSCVMSSCLRWLGENCSASSGDREGNSGSGPNPFLWEYF